MKRPKKQGGRFQWTMMLFRNRDEAVQDFMEQVNFWTKKTDRPEKECARISFSIEWEPRSSARRINDAVIERDNFKHKSHPHHKPMKNPIGEEPNSNGRG